EELAKELQTVAIVDNSGLINQDVVKQSGLNLHKANKTDSLREDVREGQIPALVVFPKHLTEERSYKIYVEGNNITTISAVGSLAENILKTSLFLPLGSAEVIALAQNGASSDITFFRDGQETAGFN